MKIWEIKAQSLRLMFADTDIQFSFDDFDSGTIYDNSNTRDKLVRMNDSISRAIDLYYIYVGDKTDVVNLGLSKQTFNGVSAISVPSTKFINSVKPYRIDVSINGVVTEKLDYELNFTTGVVDFLSNHSYFVSLGSSAVFTVYKNETSLSSLSPFTISKLEVVENLNYSIEHTSSVDFMYDDINKIIYFKEKYADLGDSLRFVIYYKTKRLNLTSISNDETDVDSYYIPPEVQRQIPYFVKAELYEEDEPDIAQSAKQTYIMFLTSIQRRLVSNVKTKVKRVFNRRFDV